MLQALYLQGFEAPHKTAADRNATNPPADRNWRYFCRIVV